MNKLSLIAVGTIVFSLAINPMVSATSIKIKDNFNNLDSQWNFINFEEENGVQVIRPGLMCGTDACASLVKSGGDKFMRIAVNPSTTPGFYTDTEVNQVALGDPAVTTDSGPFTATYGHPVTLEARIRWNNAYNYDGTGPAVGSSGVILWNSAVLPGTGPTSQYDAIGFSWVSDNTIGGLVKGFTSLSYVNRQFAGISRPASPININEWIDVKLVWEENISQQQSVTYYANGELIATHMLPERLKGLSVEMWNDNQEPTFGPGGLVQVYSSPSIPQHFEIDKVSVKQK
jgi:hypothetical protein